MLRTPTFLIGLLFLSLAQSGHNLTVAEKSQSISPISPISLGPCEVSGTAPGTKEKVLCGQYEVFEDRVAKAGRKILLKIVVFPATGSDKLADPFWYVPGGPGSSKCRNREWVGYFVCAEHQTSRFCLELTADWELVT